MKITCVSILTNRNTIGREMACAVNPHQYEWFNRPIYIYIYVNP